MPARPQGRILKRYRLKGPYAGSDCVLCGYLFKAGELEVSLLETEHESLAKVLWFYQAEEVTEDGKRDVQADQARNMGSETRSGGEVAAPGSAGRDDRNGSSEAKGIDEGRRLVPGGDGPATGVDRLHAVLRALDPKVDANWTSAGRPAIQAVEAAYGKPVTRAQIEAALPGLTRRGIA